MSKRFQSLAPFVIIIALAGCSNSPQQPSDSMSENSSDTPLFETSNDSDPARTAESDVDLIEEFPDESTTGSIPETTDTSVTPIATGTAVARSATFNQIEGSWAPTRNDCEQQGGTYAISATTVERPGRLCTVAELIGAGQDSVTAALLCPVGDDGTEERELLRLSVEDDALTVNIVGSPNPPETLQRCAP